MTGSLYAHLPQRGIISVAGDDAREFLQGIISNDINKVKDGAAIWAAFLTPQGKYLYDFFIVENDGMLLIDCEAERLPEFFKKLKMYKLRSKVDLNDASEQFEVFAIFGGDGGNPAAEYDGDGVTFADPRHPSVGARAIMPKGTGAVALDGLGIAPSDATAYDTHRLALGLPDGSRDLIVDKSTLLENGFDELHGVDWDKGCYMGQELTARTKYRGLVKKRLLPVFFEGTAPQPGTPVTADGKEVGEMRSSQGSLGLALIRLEAIEAGTALEAEGMPLTASKPDWANF